MTPELKPVENKIVLKFLDEETDEERDQRQNRYNAPSATVEPEKALYAQVVAVGPKSDVKKGNVVLVRQWARDGLDLGDDTVLTDDYCVMAVVLST